MYGSSKSTASLWEVFIRCLENPNGVTLITAPTLQLLKRTSIKTLIDEIIPPPLLESYNKSDGQITLTNGHVIYTIPSDDEEKLRSINCSNVHIEEASGIKRSIYDQLLTRMRHQKAFNRAMFVCSNPENNWIKDVIVNNDHRRRRKHPEHEDYDPTMHTFIWPTKLNYNLPPDFVTKISKGKPQYWIKRYVEGSFEHSSGQVYPNFGDCIIDPIDNFDEMKRTWQHFVGMDVGYQNPTAVIFGALEESTGTVYIYDEYYVPNRLVPEHAKHIKPKIEKIPYGLLKFMVIDPSARNRLDNVNGKSVQGLYQEYGMYFQEGNNNIQAGILRLNSYIERGRVKVFRTCANLCREMVNYKFPEVTMDNEKNLDENPLKKDDHSCFIAGTMIETSEGLKPIENLTEGMLVLTREGYRPIVDWAMTHNSAEVIRVELSNGKSLTGTTNHPVIMAEGKRELGSLVTGDVLIGVDASDVSVLGVYVEPKRQEVYNITVDEHHEYYANGVLVSNCDAIRYMFMRLPEDPDMLMQKNYEPRYDRKSIRDLYDDDEDDYGTMSDNFLSYY